MMRKYFSLFFVLFFIKISSHAQEIIQLGQGDVYDYCFSPQGSMAYLANGKSVNIWDIEKKIQLGSLEDGPDNTIVSIDITKDSSFLVASSLDSMIAIWSLSNFTLIKKIKIHSIANKVLFDGNGSSVFAGLRNGDLLSVNVFSGETIAQKKTGLIEVSNIALLDSIHLLAVSGSNGVIQLWDSNNFTFNDQKKKHSGFIRGLVFNNNGTQLYTCGDDGKVVCSNIKNNKLENDYKIRNGFNKSWIISLDMMEPQVVAFATLRGDVFIYTKGMRYFYHLPNNIFKIRFLPHKSNYIVVGVSTNNGLKIIWAKNMKSKIND